MNSLLGLEELLPVQKSRSCVWSPTGGLEVVTSQTVSSSSASVQKPPRCLTFAEVYPHKNKWQNFCLNLWQFKIKSSKIFSHLFSWANERSIWPSPVLTSISILEHAQSFFCWQWVQLLFEGLRSEILGSWTLWDLSRPQYLPTCVCRTQCHSVCPRPMVCVAVGLACKQQGYPWGTHNWRDICTSLPSWEYCDLQGRAPSLVGGAR